VGGSGATEPELTWTPPRPTMVSQPRALDFSTRSDAAAVALSLTARSKTGLSGRERLSLCLAERSLVKQ
jgi:hypothetical protein